MGIRQWHALGQPVFGHWRETQVCTRRAGREIPLNALRTFLRLETEDSPWHSSAVIRKELFSIERLELHAASLATAQSTTSKPPARRSLGSRLRENERVLIENYHAIAAVTIDGQPISSAAEWFLDSYHLVEDRIAVDGISVPGDPACVVLVDDGQVHAVHVKLCS